MEAEAHLLRHVFGQNTATFVHLTIYEAMVYLGRCIKMCQLELLQSNIEPTSARVAGNSVFYDREHHAAHRTDIEIQYMHLV
jgi:hypothetical protein